MIEAGKKLPIVDVGSAFYPNMVRSLRKIHSQPNTMKSNIKHLNTTEDRLPPPPGLVQPLVLPEHVEDQQGQGLLHGRQTHHHARGGGEKQRDHLQSIRINIDFEMPTSVKRSQSIQISR